MQTARPLISASVRAGDSRERIARHLGLPPPGRVVPDPTTHAEHAEQGDGSAQDKVHSPLTAPKYVVLSSRDQTG